MPKNAELFREPMKGVILLQYRFVGGLLFVFGGAMVWFATQYQNWLGGFTGVIFVVGGALLLFINEGVEIDISLKKYRFYSTILMYSYGKWKPLPKVDYITIYSENEGVTSHVASLHYTAHDQKLKIALIYGNHQQIAIGRYNNKEKAVEVGKLLAANLKTKLLDCTKKEPIWMIE
jgi:hypothetical protein